MTTADTFREFVEYALLEAPLVERLRAVHQVLEERDAQDAEWGWGPDHDAHLVGDFFRFIAQQLEKADAEAFNGAGFPQPGGGYYNPKLARLRLMKIAALAIAAMESLDRRGLAR